MIDISKPTDFNRNSRPSKVKVTVFDSLIELNVPFAVVCAYITVDEIPDESGNDYCIIAAKKDSFQVRDLGFCQMDSHPLVVERKLNEGIEVEKFKAMVREGKFRLVQDNADGKIWEYCAVNNFVAYCGGRVST